MYATPSESTWLQHALGAVRRIRCAAMFCWIDRAGWLQAPGLLPGQTIEVIVQLRIKRCVKWGESPLDEEALDLGGSVVYKIQVQTKR